MKYGYFNHIPVYERMLKYFYDSVDYDVSDNSLCNYDKLVNNIYRQILLSKHFLLHICKGDRNLVPFMVKKIYSYYSYKDKQNLLRQLQVQEDNDDFNPVFYFPNLWDSDLTLFELQDDVNYKLYVQEVNDKVSKSVKHKELNDLNRIFNYL